jgi:peptidoglycan lytic transglycosylase
LVLLPLVSLHHTHRTSHTVVAASSSFDLAARHVPARASRSAPRRLVDVIPVDEVTATTTTSTEPVAVSVAARHVSATASSSHPHTSTTVHKRTTTTTTKPKKTTTTTSHSKSPSAASPPASPPKLRPYTPPSAPASSGQSETGQATWYQTPDPAMCAHKTLPMGTIVTVTDVDNGKSTTCKVGDRGPYVDGRIIDLSPEAFSQLAPLSEGVLNVKITW